jgi:hypothetical protein
MVDPDDDLVRGHLFLLLARTPLSLQPFRGFAQGCWLSGRRDLVPLSQTYTPRSCAKLALAHGRTACDR